jgi:2-polyprenyl-3-methyl-5-hydroxy-6-metoxy-1,4-benzoquinol methylase
MAELSDRIDYTRYYSKWHSDTPEHIRAMQRFYQRILGPYLPTDKAIRILDVGCGAGFALKALEDLGYSCLEGIDADQGQILSCQAKQLAVTYTEDSPGFLAQHPSCYDLILALDVIEHIPQASQLLFTRSIQAALKPGGSFICTVPNANSALSSRWRYNDWTHYTSFTEHSLDFLLYNSGFENVQVFSTEFFQPKLLSRAILRNLLFKLIRGFRRLEMVAELGWKQAKDIPLSLNILATASKPL